MSDLYNDKGVEFPTRTTAHNQVIPVAIADPSAEVIENYVALKVERGQTWDQVASNVDVQDPALGDWLRKHGAEHEKAAADVAPFVAPLTERAVNPLTTVEEREALVDPSKAKREDDAPAKASKSAPASK